MAVAIDLSSFEKALNTLDRAILRAREAPGDEELRDAVIQRFEYTYELAWKSLKRVLEEAAASSEEIDYLSFKDLIRRGAESGMIQDPQEWFAFRESRNKHHFPRLQREEGHLSLCFRASVCEGCTNSAVQASGLAT